MMRLVSGLIGFTAALLSGPLANAQDDPAAPEEAAMPDDAP